jgi:hypothetical protein
MTNLDLFKSLAATYADAGDLNIFQELGREAAYELISTVSPWSADIEPWEFSALESAVEHLEEVHWDNYYG